MAKTTRSTSLGAEALLGRKDWAPLPSIAVLFGSARFFKEEIVGRFAAELFGSGTHELRRFQGPSNERQLGELPLAVILDELRTPSFFAAKRLIIVERADAFLGAHRDVIEGFITKGFAGGHLILFLDGKLDARTKFAKALANNGWVVSCDTPYDRPPPWESRAPIWDSPLSHWIVRRARGRGVEISPQTAFTLHDRVGTDLSVLDEELEKLATLLATRGESAITEQHILASTGDLREDSIFGLVDLILAGKRQEALDSAERLFDRGYHAERGQVVRDSPGIVLPLVASLVNRLRSVRRAHAIASAGGGPDDWLRERLVQKPFLDRFRRQMRATPPSTIRELLDALAELDMAVKSGGDTRRLLILLIARYCKGVPSGAGTATRP